MLNIIPAANTEFIDTVGFYFWLIMVSSVVVDSSQDAKSRENISVVLFKAVFFCIYLYSIV